MKKLLSLAVASALIVGVNAQELRSPDGNLRMDFSLDESGAPVYKLEYKGKIAVAPSRLGLKLKSSERNEFGADFTSREHKIDPQTSLYDGIELAGVETSTFDETW